VECAAVDFEGLLAQSDRKNAASLADALGQALIASLASETLLTAKFLSLKFEEHPVDVLTTYDHLPEITSVGCAPIPLHRTPSTC
jgi:hypothetical protein